MTAHYFVYTPYSQALRKVPLLSQSYQSGIEGSERLICDPMLEKAESMFSDSKRQPFPCCYVSHKQKPIPWLLRKDKRAQKPDQPENRPHRGSLCTQDRYHVTVDLRKPSFNEANMKQKAIWRKA